MKKITSIMVINEVAEYYNLTYEQIVGKGREKVVVEARDIGIYLINKLTTSTTEEISNLFGKDYATIPLVVRKVKKKLSEPLNNRFKINSLSIYTSCVS